MERVTLFAVETVSRLFTLGHQGFWQVDLGSDYVAWPNDERSGAYDSIVLLSKAHDEGARLVGGDELTKLIYHYPASEVVFRNLVTGETIGEWGN
jgi:hypothetical protein